MANTPSRPNWVGISLVLALWVSSAACARKPELGSDKLVERSKEARARKDYTHAMLDLRSAAKLEPANARVRYEMGLLYSEVGDLNMAEFQFQEALRMNPGYTDAQGKLALITARRLEFAGNPGPATQGPVPLVWRQNDAEVVAALNLGLLAVSEKRDTEQQLRDVLVLFPGRLAAEGSTASAKLEEHDLRGVEQAFRSAVQRDPKSVAAHWALGRVYSIEGKLTEAEAEFTAALHLDPNATAVRDDLAQVQRKQGKVSEAEKSYQKLVATGRDHADAYAAFLLQQGRTDEAIREYRRLANVDPQDRIARSRVIAAYLAAKRFGEAEAVVNRILEKNQKDTDALLQRAEIYLVAREHEKAQNDLSLIFGFRPDWADAHYILARVFQALGATQNVRRELNEAVRLDPSLLPARVDLAGALIAVNDAKAALDLMAATPDEEREALPAIIQKNWALLALRRSGDVRGNLQKALSNYPSSPELLLQRGLLRIQEMDKEGAREDLLRVLRQSPDDLRAKRALASISPAKVPGNGRHTGRSPAIQ